MKKIVITKTNVKELAPHGVYTVSTGSHENVTVSAGVRCDLVHEKGSAGNQTHSGEGDQYHYGVGNQYHYDKGNQLHDGMGVQLHLGDGCQCHYSNGLLMLR